MCNALFDAIVTLASNKHNSYNARLEMIKNELDFGVFHYTFPPRKETQLFGDAIIAIVSGNRAILIDVGYEDEAKQVVDDLSMNNISVDTVIVSHFHADHLFGISVFSGVPFYGAVGFNETLIFEETLDEEMEKYTPSFIVDKPTILDYGNHKIELIPFPGHSVCTMLIKINELFLYMADEVMLTTDGKLMLPYLCNGDKDTKRQRQIKAYARLKDYSRFSIIPAHGSVFEGDKLNGYLQDIESYLNAVIETNGLITYEDAVKNCAVPLMQSNWHEDNCK